MFEAAEKDFQRQRPEHRQDLWQGLWKKFGGRLYSASEKYHETVKHAAGYFLKLGIGEDYAECERLASGLHYQSLHDDVLAAKKVGVNKGKPRRVTDIDPRFLRDKAKKSDCDVASFSREGTEPLPDDLKARTVDPQMELEATEQKMALRKG